MSPVKSIRVNDLNVGGKPVEFKVSTGTLDIAGEELSLEQWLETRRRIDMLLSRVLTPADWKELREKMAWLGKRDRLPQELRDYETPPHPPVSGFLTQNLGAIMNSKRGLLRKAPWWLRWLYDAVVSKENYGETSV